MRIIETDGINVRFREKRFNDLYFTICFIYHILCDKFKIRFIYRIIITELYKLISCDAHVLIREYEREKTNNNFPYVDNIPRYINRDIK